MITDDAVIIVNEADEAVGLMPKLEAHEKGILHRAFSVFLFNTNGELLMQQRALTKYHSAGLWSNTCCSHPRNNESVLAAATRRLQEEMGMQTPLHFLYAFQYCEAMENGLIEHEYDHVFIGQTNETPHINPTEVADWQYRSPAFLLKDIELHPAHYSIWFRISLPTILEKIQSTSFFHLNTPSS